MQDKLHLTITDVRTSRDLTVADVRISWSTPKNRPVGQEVTRDTLMEILQGAAGFLRGRLARVITARTTPALRFHYDDTLERTERIANLLAADSPEKNN